ncbi:MAG TPA: lysoplasmalogenase family protein [Clostridia bacterium]|nr:lysoplasmalogenase family protein [Clostridia bacterium]
MTFHIILACFYAVALVTYFHVETKPKLFPVRVTVKIFLATTYIIAAVAALLIKGVTAEYKIFILLACCFAWFGDLLLLFKKTFGIGVFFFLLSNLTIILAQTSILANTQINAGFIWVTAAVFAVVYGGLLVLQITKFCTFGKYAVPLNIYIAVMTLSGLIGIALAIFGASIFTAVFGCGVALFMVSDYLLGAHLFKFKTNKVLIANSAFYFSGMFLIALSLVF